MPTRSICALAALLLLAVFAGCGDEKEGAPAAGGETAVQPAKTTPPAAAPAPVGEGGAPGTDKAAPAGGPADPAKVEAAANTALKVMVAVSSAVRGAKGDCARMKQNVTGVMSVAQKWRDQLAEQYKEPGVRQGVREGVAFGQFKELTMNLMATRDGAKACPELAPQLDEIRAEADGSGPGGRAP